MSNIALQKTKFVRVIDPAAIVDNAAYTTEEIDTLGYDHLTIVCYLGATDIAMTALAVQESDTSGSGFATVTGLDANGDTNTDGVAAELPTATDDNGMVVFEVDLRYRKRYIDLDATAGNGATGTFLSAIGILSSKSSGLADVSATERGALDILRV